MLLSLNQRLTAISSCCICHSINISAFTAKTSVSFVFRFNSTVSQSPKENNFTSRESLSSNHCFKNLFPWKRKEDFINNLHSSIVFNEGGLIAINKPYGVPVYKKVFSEDVQKVTTQTLPYIHQDESPYSLEDALPDLKKKLNVENIKILKSAERYSSGIALLATTNDTINKVKTAILRAKPRKQPHLIHMVITKGYPTQLNLKEYVGMRLMDIGVNNSKQPVIVKDFSKQLVKQNIIKPVHVEYRAIAVNNKLSCSLLEIAASSVKWHFLRVYAASKVSCILGDTLYSSRVREILGQTININPQNFIAQDIQQLPNEVCQRLMIPPGPKGHLMIPVMIHLHSIVLPQYMKKEDLVINAPPPYHFQWTRHQLNLEPMTL